MEEKGQQYGEPQALSRMFATWGNLESQRTVKLGRPGEGWLKAREVWPLLDEAGPLVVESGEGPERGFWHGRALG